MSNASKAWRARVDDPEHEVEADHPREDRQDHKFESEYRGLVFAAESAVRVDGKVVEPPRR